MKVDVAAFNKDLVATFTVIVKLQTSRRFVSSSCRYLLDQVVKSRSVRRPMVVPGPELVQGCSVIAVI